MYPIFSDFLANDVSLLGMQEVMPGNACAIAYIAKPAEPMRNITRDGNGEGNAWLVEVEISRGLSKNTYHKCFADSYHRNKASALSAAQAWRDAMENQNIRLNSPGQQTSRGKKKAAETVGVYRVVCAKWQGETLKHLRIHWLAITPGYIAPRRNRSFSTFRYGEEEARRLAVAARKQFEREAWAAASKPGRTELRNIHRVERKLFGIWYVSIDCCRSGHVRRKPFSDLLYGNKATALAAAQAWRDEIARQPLEPSEENWPATMRTG